MSPASLGDIFNIVKAFVAIRKRWQLSSWQAQLEEEKRVLATERQVHGVLLQYDQQFRSLSTGGVVLSVDQPVRSYRESSDRVRLTFHIRLRNPWVYSFTLERMAVSVGMTGFGAHEVHPYIKKQLLGPLSETTVTREFVWEPSPAESKQLHPNVLDAVEMFLEIEAYLRQEGKEFAVSGRLSASAYLQPLDSVRLQL